MIPLRLWIYLGALLAAVSAVGYATYEVYQAGDRNGAARVQMHWDAAKADYEQALQAEQQRQAQVVTKVETVYVDRVKVVHEKGEEVIREVEKLVPVGSCDLPGGFRVLHDAAAGAQPLPADPSAAAAAADPVEATTAAETVAENYALCNENSARLTALQSLVKEITHATSP